MMAILIPLINHGLKTFTTINFYNTVRRGNKRKHNIIIMHDKLGYYQITLRDKAKEG